MIYEYRATVRRVVDGDTMDLDVDLGMNVHSFERVRFYGVNTPETNRKAQREAGLRAKRFVELWVKEHPDLIVTTIRDKTGKYGRYLAMIRCDSTGEYLNELLLTNGLAVPYFGGRR